MLNETLFRSGPTDINVRKCLQRYVCHNYHDQCQGFRAWRTYFHGRFLKIHLDHRGWFRFCLLRRRQAVTNGRKCSGEQVEAVSGEPAEARRSLGRIVSPFVFAISRLVPLTLHRMHRASSSVSGARLRFRRSTRADSRGRARGRRAGKTSEPWPAIPSRILALRRSRSPSRCSLASSFPIHSFVVPTPRISPIHSLLTRWRARARARVIADGVLRVITCNLFIYP